MIHDEEAIPVANYNYVMTKLVSNTTTPSEVKDWIDTAIQNKSWLNLLFHYLVPSPAGSTEYEPSDFQEIVDYAATKLAELDVVTLSDMLDAE